MRSMPLRAPLAASRRLLSSLPPLLVLTGLAVAAAPAAHAQQLGEAYARVATLRSAEEPRVPGHSAHVARGRIVHDAPQQCAVLELLGRRDALEQRGRRAKQRLAHAQRLENALSRELLQRHSAQLVDDLAQQNEIDVAVDEALVRLRDRDLAVRALDAVFVPAPDRFEVEIRAQA